MAGLNDPTQAASPGAAIPQGATIGDAPTGAAIPQGAVIGDNPNTPGQPSQPTSTSQPGQDEGFLEKTGEAAGNAIVGAGKGLLSTLSGTDEWARKHLPAVLTNSNFGFGKPADLQHVKEMATPQGTAQEVGYGGETLMEFMLGDEALKALPLAKRLEIAAKTMRTVEGSPRIVQALKVGASVLKEAGLHGTEAGIVQGAQTLARTGDAGEAAKDAATTGATAGALSTGTGAVGKVLSHFGSSAEGAANLARVAGNAPTKEEVAQSISNKINKAKDDLHTNYESGIQDLNDRLQGAEVSAQDNPLAGKAKELLSEPNPEEHPTVSQAKQAAGDRLDKKVKSLLESIASGELPGEGEAAAEPSGLLDQFGNTIPANEAEATTKLAPPYKVNDLVTLRQTVRKLADSYEYGDVNSRALRSLINGFGDKVSPMDETIEHLAEQSGDASALSDYRQLRANYRDKINLFDNPVIQKLRDGKVDDAAKDFVGVVRNGTALPTAGKIRFNTDALEGIVGYDGLKQFGRQVFGTMLQDSVENDRFNPAKFIETWKRVNEETKGNLFDMNNAKNGLNKLVRDAQSAAELQHLTRLGVLGGVGAAAGALGPVSGPLGVGLGTLLGLTVAEGGGIAKGREMLNYVANHPAVWATFRAAGKAANSGTAKTAANVARGTLAQNSESIRSGLKNVYQSVAGALGQ